MDPNNTAQPTPAAPVQPQPIQPIQPIPTIPDTQAAGPALPKKRNKLLLIIIASVSAFLILLSTLTVMYAYGVIPAGNKAFQEAVSSFVQGLPFMPKTLPYVLKTSVKAHEKVTKFVIDASIAVSSDSLAILLGSRNFDLEIKGPIDYSDINNPMASLNAKIKDFNLDFIGKGYFSYFRITEIPASLALLMNTYMGIEEKDFLNKWFYYDETPLQTDARAALDEQNKKEKENEKIVSELFTTLKDPEVIKVLTMTNQSLGDIPTYHIHFAPNDQVLDLFWGKYMKNVYPESTEADLSKNKISDTVTAFVLDIWIDRKTYFVRKSISTFKIKGGGGYTESAPSLSLLPTQNSDISVSTAVVLSDYGKQADFTSPSGAVEIMEYFKSLSSKMASKSAALYGNQNGISDSGTNPYARQIGQANDTKRRSDVTMLLNAIGQYAASNGGILPAPVNNLPVNTPTELANTTSLAHLCEFLVPKYIPALPVDPLLNDANGIEAKDCAGKWSTRYSISRDATNRVTVSAPGAEVSKPIQVMR